MITIPVNYVAIEAVDKITEYNGMKLSAFADPHYHQPNWGYVRIVPDSLVFHQLDPRGKHKGIASQYERMLLRQDSLDYKTQIDIEVGDLVMFKYIAMYDYHDESTIIVDGVKLYLIRYDLLYCALSSSGDIKMLNDQVFLKPIFEDVDIAGHKKRKRVEGRGIVAHVPKTESAYADYPEWRCQRPAVGSVVAFNRRFAPRVEYDMHRKLDDAEGSYMRVESKNICLVLDE